MDAILVRIGIDSTFGHWNAPAHPVSGEFVYLPIPEEQPQHHEHRVLYRDLLPDLEAFSDRHSAGLRSPFPPELAGAAAHLDPDFRYSTYGDNGARRGSGIARLNSGDLLIFYAGLRSVEDQSLIYALVGMLTVHEVVAAGNVPAARWGENAHTRRIAPSAADIVVRGRPESSGRFTRHLPVGERRAGAYRVQPDLLAAWGGLSVRDGFIQRSGRPPHFLQPERFVRWLEAQNVDLLRRNN